VHTRILVIVTLALLASCDSNLPDGECYSSDDCTPGKREFCSFEGSDPCGVTGAVGHCAPATLACEQGSPAVCGCDGQTYANVCIAANVARVASSHDGVCTP
jgi:hypothetical protein